MRIAAHHIPGTLENKLSSMLHSNPAYTPTCAWPEDCTVQWGNGLIPATPFFEAFPKGSFIRGEGATIAEAELRAFEQYQRDLACNHVWGRQRPGRDCYTNGAGWCRKCGGFRGSMFPEIKPLGWWRKPLTAWEVDWLQSMQEDQELNEAMDRKYPHHRDDSIKLERRLRLRFNLFGGESRPALENSHV